MSQDGKVKKKLYENLLIDDAKSYIKIYLKEKVKDTVSG